MRRRDGRRNGVLGQAGNPSSTPARRSARTSAIDAAGRRIRPETVIATAMTTKDVGRVARVPDDDVMDEGRRGARQPGQRQHREAPEPVQRKGEDELGGRTLDEAGQQGVDAPGTAQQRREPGGDELGKQRGAGLADDERRHQRGHQPGAVQDVLDRTDELEGSPDRAERPEGDTERDADDGGHHDVASPPAGVGAGQHRSPECGCHVRSLLVERATPPTTGTASTSRRACFLRRYEPDQVPRVCGACHTLSARGAPRRRCLVVARC